MADKILVECVCGGETDAPASAVGQTVACQACGGPVVVAEATIIRRPGATVAKPAPMTPGPSAPKTPTGVSAAVQAAFGGDDEGDPPARTAAPAPPEAPREVPSRHSPLREWDPIYGTGAKCVRCGRAFRGSWDEFETPQGTICYICSNLALEGEPERVRKETEAREAASKTAEAALVAKTKEDAWSAPETFLGIDTKSPKFQRFLMFAAVATIGIAYLILITGWGTPNVSSGRTTSSGVTEENLPKSLEAAWAVCYYLARYFVVLVTIYLTLWRRNALPHDSFLRNMLQLAIPVAFCAGVGLVAAFVAHGVGSGGDLGFVMPAIVYFIGFLIQAGIVLTAYDWFFWDLLWGFLFYYISRFLVGSGLSLLFFGLAKLLT